MSREKTSIIWKLSSNDFVSLIKKSNTYTEVLSSLGLPTKSGGNYKTLKKRIAQGGIDVSHIEAGKKLFRGRGIDKKQIEDILVCGSNFRNASLREKLIKCGIFENKCSVCGQLPWWNGKKLVLQLDHINGNHTDNRLENLRILCPHCHTQTETYGAKNKLKVTLESDFCMCGSKKKRQSKTCRGCKLVVANGGRVAKEKIIWPDRETLQALLLEKPTVQIAKELGVSDVAIGRRAQKLGLKKPERGYWKRQVGANGGIQTHNGQIGNLKLYR
jgi:hypothetical protein